MPKEDQLPIEEMTMDDLRAAIGSALVAFAKDFAQHSHEAKNRARRVSITLEKLLKRYRTLSVQEA